MRSLRSCLEAIKNCPLIPPELSVRIDEASLTFKKKAAYIVDGEGAYWGGIPTNTGFPELDRFVELSMLVRNYLSKKKQESQLTIPVPQNVDQGSQIFREFFLTVLESWEPVSDPEKLKIKGNDFIQALLTGANGIALGDSSFYHNWLKTIAENMGKAWQDLEEGSFLFPIFSQYQATMWGIKRLELSKVPERMTGDFNEDNKWEVWLRGLNLLSVNISPDYGIEAKKVSTEDVNEVARILNLSAKFAPPTEAEELRSISERIVSQSRDNTFIDLWMESLGILILLESDTVYPSILT